MTKEEILQKIEEICYSMIEASEEEEKKLEQELIHLEIKLEGAKNGTT